MDFNKFVAEIVGTAILILLGDGVVAGVLLAKSKAANAGWIVITWAWAMAVFCGVIIAGPISGAHLNPAVTIGFWTYTLANGTAAGGAYYVDTASMVAYWAAEMIGAMIGASLVVVHYWDHFKATEDQGLKLAVFSTGPNIRNYWLNLVSEIIGTFVLVFVIFTFGDWKGGTLGALGALPVALLVLVIGLALGGTTGYAINPARDLGPRIVHAILPVPGKGGSDWGYAWVPVIGPLIGGVIAALFYFAVFTKAMGVS
jgi:glycerol uptake facilitator protein